MTYTSAEPHWRRCQRLARDRSHERVSHAPPRPTHTVLPRRPVQVLWRATVRAPETRVELQPRRLRRHLQRCIARYHDWRSRGRSAGSAGWEQVFVQGRGEVHIRHRRVLALLHRRGRRPESERTCWDCASLWYRPLSETRPGSQVAYQPGKNAKPVYALEGSSASKRLGCAVTLTNQVLHSVAVAGSAIQW